MSPETSDANAASQSKTPAGAAPFATNEGTDLSLDEQERQRAKSRMKLRLAQTVAAVLGVLILIVVGLMVNLGLRKYAEKNAAPSSWVASQPISSESVNSAPVTSGAGQGAPAIGLVGPECDLVSSNLDSARLVLIFDGQPSACSRLIIINTNTGTLVLDRPIKG